MLMVLEQVQVVFISKHDIIIGEGSSRLESFFKCSSPLLIIYVSHNLPRGGGWVLDLFIFPLDSLFLEKRIVCQDMGPSILYIFSPPLLGALFY